MCPTFQGYVEKVPKKLNLIFTRLKVIFGDENKWKHWLVPPFIWNMRIENLNMNILISWWTILLFHFMRLYNCTRQLFNSNAMNVPNVRVENHNTKRWMGWYGRCFLFFFCECLHLCSSAMLFGEHVLCLELEDFENHPYMEFCRCSFGTFKSTFPSSNFHRMDTMHEAWGLKTTTGPHPVTLPILSIKRSPSRPQRLNEVIRSESWTDQPLSSQHKKSPWSDNFFIPRH